MTYDQDPARWTSSPEEAPDVLRSAFTAARNEGPNRAQVRALAVKLAAASAGGAVAVGTVKAASVGNTVASAASWSATKIASVIALAGSVVTGAVVWQQTSSPGESTGQHARPSIAARASEVAGPHDETEASSPPDVGGTAPAGDPSASAQVPANDVPAAAPLAPSVEPLAEPKAPRATAPVVEALRVAEQPVEPAVSGIQPARSPVAEAARRTEPAKPSAERSDVLGQAQVQPKARPGHVSRGHANAAAPRSALDARSRTSQAAGTGATAGQAVQAPDIHGTSAENAEGSELQLLQSAQAALRARPREAFQLTQRHRRLYPQGEFAQERDALAIQALMRAGETDSARELAEAFIRSYPSSPHAHRFREAMGIR